MAESGPLWAKDLPLDTLIHRFTVGEDPLLDRRLVPADCLASAAHARMLARVGLLAEAEARALVDALRELYAEAEDGRFAIRPEQEDAHTALEHALIERVGEPGRKIHLARSRNDQVLTALRLWLRRRVLEHAGLVAELVRAFLAVAARHATVPLPGYTHLQRAMPSSVAQWAIGFAEGLLEELEALEGVYRRLDRCPLGAAAGFGVDLPIDRAYSARLLGFERVQRSPPDCIAARGRHAQAWLDALASVGGVLEKFCWDGVLFCTAEFGFMRLPDAYTTGSSIMPQKRNPDVLELARARCRELRALALWHAEVMGNLPSNYHRDQQLGKRPLFLASDLGAELLAVLLRLLPGIEFDPGRCTAALTDELYATAEAYARVGEGQSFRAAYRDVGLEVLAGRFDARRARARAGAVPGTETRALEADLAELDWRWQQRRTAVQTAEDMIWEW